MKSRWTARTWWLKAGVALLLVTLSVSLTIGIVAQEADSVKLYQNFPNPFSQVTVIKYYVPSSGQVKLTVRNMLGSELAEIENEKKDKGEHSVRFEGSSYPSGQYTYTLTFRADDETSETKLVKRMYLVR